jgi:hypothetical protein
MINIAFLPRIGVRTYKNALSGRKRTLHGLKWYQGTMLQIVRKTERFNVFLKTWRNLALISPKAVSSKFVCETGVDVLYFAEL